MGKRLKKGCAFIGFCGTSTQRLELLFEHLKTLLTASSMGIMDQTLETNCKIPISDRQRRIVSKSLTC